MKRARHISPAMACLAVGLLGSWHHPLQARTEEQADTRAIVVTGSRIRGADAMALEPTAQLSSTYIDERSLILLADALNEMPGVRGSVTPAGSQASYGQGVNFISLFGMGTSRTLTLINGRRVVSSNVPSILGNAAPGTQVDLNAIPTALVERVERVAVGGAPVYGTDAIAGTVNVVLKRRLSGLEARASQGLTSAGDNHRWGLSLAGGTGFAGGRGHITMAVGHDRVEGVLANQRRLYRDNASFLANPCPVLQAGVCTATSLAANLGPAGRTPANDGRVNSAIGFNNGPADGFPGAVLVRDVTIPSLSPGGVLSSGAGAYAWQFAADGSLVRYDRGVIFGAPVPGPLAAAATASGGDGLSANDYAQITSSLQRTNAALLLDYEASDSLRFFAEGLYYHGKGDELVQQPTYNATLFSGVSGPLTFSTANPFLSDQPRQQLAALGYGTTFQMSRANADLADLTGYATSSLYRMVGGLEGAFSIGSRPFDYQASLIWGRTDFTDFGQTINQQRFVNAINVARVNGQIACSATTTVFGLPAGSAPVADPGCVPLNLFGTGAPAPAAVAYILQETVSRSRMEQLVANVNVGGAPFTLFGNPVRFNAGFEHHRESARFSPDPLLEAGLGRSAAVAPTQGRYHLNELSGEVLLPIIAPENHTLINRLDLFGRIRQVFASNGGQFTSWAAGGRLSPLPGVTWRGNFTRSFRSPSITELYSPRSPVRVAVPDLCSPASIGLGPAPETRRANCTAFLNAYPGATPLAAATATVPAFSGGNPALRPETADSFTFGLLLQPSMVPGLTLTADYLNIHVADPISNLSAAQINQGCFDNPDFNSADPARGNAFCALIGRAASGQVLSDPLNPAVITGYVNGKAMRMSGVQASFSWLGTAMGGELELAGDLFHLRYRLNDVTGIAPTRADGLIGDPRWQGQLRLHYAASRWGIGANVNYMGAQLLAVTNRGPAPNDAREFDHFDPFATLDAFARLQTRDGFRLTLSITNLLNRMGQTYFGVIIPGSVNDALGRRMTLALRKEW